MIFPRKYPDIQEVDLALCNVVIKNTLDLLRGEKMSEDVRWKEGNVRAVFAIMDMYYYNAFGWVRRNVPVIASNRILRRSLKVGQRCVYPEWRGDPRPAALHLEELLEKFAEEYDPRVLAEDGPRAIKFFALVRRCVDKAIKRGRY